MSSIKRIAITSGEPAGIGPELIVKIAQRAHSDQLIVIGDPQLFNNTAQALGLPLSIITFDPNTRISSQAGTIYVYPVPLVVPAVAGQLSADNASYVIETLKIACQGCLAQVFDAMVTPPVHKGIINQSGLAFSGHTEYLQQQTAASEVVMMLACKEMRVALATTHIPICEVSNALTKDKLTAILQVLISDLRTKFSIQKPRILICGLNPHAGENGHMGNEEITTITPVLNQFKNCDVELIGPLPADTLFNAKTLDTADAVLAMYHDQGLPVLKYASFGNAVNITLGLPIIRTSVDHGTALDIAGKNQADTGSLAVAIEYASTLANSASPHEQRSKL